MRKRVLLSFLIAACGTSRPKTIAPGALDSVDPATPPRVQPIDPPPPQKPPVLQVGDLQAPDAIQFGFRRDAASFTTPWTAILVTLKNTGTAPLGPLTLALSAGAEFTLPQHTIASIAGGASATLTITPAIQAGLGERIVSATLTVGGAPAALSIPIFAAIGDPALEDFTFATTEWAHQATHALPRAPWPTAHPAKTPSAPYPDSAFVYIGVPPDLRTTAPTIDVIIQLHGFDGVLASTISTKKYVEQAYFANRNAVLIVPQGLYDYSGDDFGALRSQDGVQKLITEVFVVLNREGLVSHPMLGSVLIASHSGGYFSLADMLTKSGVPGGLSGVVLLDSLYGNVADYRAWIDTQSGKFVSSFQPQASGDSVYTQSQTLQGQIAQDSVELTTADDRPIDEDLASAQNLFHTVHATHNQIPLDYYADAEYWRHSVLAPRQAPMPILRVARSDGSALHLEWFAEANTHARTFTVQTSSDGQSFTALGTPLTGSGLTLLADLAAPGEKFWVRVVATYDGLGTSRPSDTYFVSSRGAKQAIVVDAFDRCLDGPMHALSHDFAARLGSDLDTGLRVQSCTNEAVEWGECDLTGAALVVWVAGSSGYDNHSINGTAAAVLTTYLNEGGKLLATGSELAYAMDKDGLTPFMQNQLKVASFADSSGAARAFASAVLPGVTAFSFGQSDTYAVPYPDVLTPQSAGHTLLTYGTPAAPLTPAAVGSTQTVSVGFPLETVTPVAARTQLVRALVSYLNP